MALMLCLWPANVVLAEDAQESDRKKDETTIEESVQSLGQQMVGIKPSPVGGIYEVEVSNGAVVYFAGGGEYTLLCINRCTPV